MGKSPDTQKVKNCDNKYAHFNNWHSNALFHALFVTFKNKADKNAH